MPIEIIPKPVAKVPPWHNWLLYASILLLVVSLIGYFMLGRRLNREKNTIQELNEDLAQPKSSEETTLEGRILAYKRKVENFSQLVDGHRYASRVFPFFERLCHPRGWFSNFTVDFEEHLLRVAGQVDSFTTLGQQLLIFEEEPLIKEVNLSSLSLGEEGGVDFSVNLFLDPKIFK